MMKQPSTFFALVAALGATSCSTGEFNVRPIKTALAAGRQPADLRVAEGNAQLALGNVGLAIEAYRKALRQQPQSVEAMVGLAHCYDRMGRSDLSRHQYEMALAVEPANTEIYALFAQSLEAQGQRDEAARVKAELAARVVAPEASREVPGSVPVLPPPPAQSVTVALAPPRPLPVAVEQPEQMTPAPAQGDQVAAVAPEPIVPMVVAPKPVVPMALAPAPPAPLTVAPKMLAPVATAPSVAAAPGSIARVFIERPAGVGLRLERLSMREVALVTRPEPRWEARTVARTATSTTIRFERKVQPAVTLLNAARIQGLAARTRTYLAGRGFAGAKIGDAPAVRRQSAIVYSSADAARAERLAAQFGFVLERREGAKAGVIVLLGRDAARDVALRPTA
jgi:hypothetical protein